MGNNFIKAARKHLGLSPQEFAKLLGVVRQTLWRYERGDPLPHTTRLVVERLLIDHDNKSEQEKTP